MKYGKVENYKVVGTCMMQTEPFPDIIPDDAELFDYIVGEKLDIDGTAQDALMESNERIGILRRDRAALIANRR